MGKTAREMNALLLEHGYLDGGPGDYGLTDKGKQYGSETYHHRGTGGSQSYNRDWTVRTWDESIVEALNADIDAAASSPSARPDLEEETDEEADTEYEDQSDPQPESHSWPPVVLVVAAVVLAGVAVSPPVRRWADEKAKPRAKRAWRTLTRRGEVEAPSPDLDPAPNEAGDPADVAEIEGPASDLE